MKLAQSVQYLKGVGPAAAKLFARLNIQTVRDILFHLPSGYIDRTFIKPIEDCELGEDATVAGEIIKVQKKSIRPTFAKAIVRGKTGEVEAVWFNQPYIADSLSKGFQVILSGKVDFYKRLQMKNPEFEIVEGDLFAETENIVSKSQRILAKYPLTEGLRQNVVRNAVNQALADCADELRDVVPKHVLKKRNLMKISDAMKTLHAPTAMSELLPARERLVYEEFFLMQIGLSLRKRRLKQTRGWAFKVDDGLQKRILARYPFKLTGAQDKSIAEIVGDMTSELPMNRLIQGDVGSGKTAVALYAMLVAIANRAQVALMAPTEILAEQHYLTMQSLLEGSRVRVELLVGGMNASERKDLLADVGRGDVQMLIGTHALIQGGVQFKRLGLIVVDEQHKFGVLQRTKLLNKGFNPDALVMTATPIPRTLSLTVYGDLDVSVIDEMPPGRMPVKTSVVPESKRHEAYDFIRKKVQAGQQVYVICPLVDESEELDLKSATETAQRMREEIFPDLRVDLIHGRLKVGEKDEVMKRFRNGEIDVLVATVVIEVGVDIPNATTMVIEHAERFGLAQLHQLRGRIGRGREQSYCLLFAEPTTEDAQRRLSIMAKTSDGFMIAEEDLAIRGPGEFFGTKQHGLPELRVANIIEDFKILQQARSDAFELVAADVNLAMPEHSLLRTFVNDFLAEKMDLIRIG